MGPSHMLFTGARRAQFILLIKVIKVEKSEGYKLE